MIFGYALFLLGAAAVIGPVLAHLLARPRFRRVPFTMMRFLQVGRRDAQSKNRIRNLLLLLLRASIVMVLAMLFAGPRLVSRAAVDEPRVVHYLALDDSLSMSYSDGVVHIDRMKAAASDIIAAAGEDDRFFLYSTASGRWWRDLPPRDASRALGEISPVAARSSLGQFLRELRAARERQPRDWKLSAAILSDFTPAMLDELSGHRSGASVDAADYFIASSAAPVSNAAVTGATIGAVSQDTFEISVHVTNYSPAAMTRSLEAVANGRVLATAPCVLPGGGRARVSVHLPLAALAEISDAERSWRGAAGAGVGAARAGGSVAVPDRAVRLPLELRLAGVDGLAADDIWRTLLVMPPRTETAVVLFGSSRRELFLLRTAIEALGASDAFDAITVREVLYDSFQPTALEGARAAFFAGAPRVVTSAVTEIDTFLKGGGRAIFFVTPDCASGAFGDLAAAGAVAAVPKTLQTAPASIDGSAAAAGALTAIDGDDGAVTALSNYRLDAIPLSGYFECEHDVETAVLLRLSGGGGFLYMRRVGAGVSFLVNTSADDALGSVLKSPAASAFCRLLIGSSRSPVLAAGFCGEAVTLPATTDETRRAALGRAVWYLPPDLVAREAAVAGGSLVISETLEPGWYRALDEPARLAAANVPYGETDVTPPAVPVVARLVANVLLEEPRAGDIVRTEAGINYRDVWRWFAWLALVLILAETVISNRTQR